MSKLAYLKIKIRSLAYESAIIHRQECRLPRLRDINKREGITDLDRELVDQRIGLNLHRKLDLRPEQRAALLAYGFIRGRRYRQMESKTWRPILTEHALVARIVQLTHKFGGLNVRPEEIAKKIQAWINEEELSDRKAA